MTDFERTLPASQTGGDAAISAIESHVRNFYDEVREERGPFSSDFAGDNFQDKYGHPFDPDKARMAGYADALHQPELYNVVQQLEPDQCALALQTIFNIMEDNNLIGKSNVYARSDLTEAIDKNNVDDFFRAARGAAASEQEAYAGYANVHEWPTCLPSEKLTTIPDGEREPDMKSPEGIWTPAVSQTCMKM